MATGAAERVWRAPPWCPPNLSAATLGMSSSLMWTSEDSMEGLMESTEPLLDPHPRSSRVDGCKIRVRSSERFGNEKSCLRLRADFRRFLEICWFPAALKRSLCTMSGRVPPPPPKSTEDGSEGSCRGSAFKQNANSRPRGSAHKHGSDVRL